MGVKSTVVMTRAEAELYWVELQLESLRAVFRAQAARMPIGMLEDHLEQLSDHLAGGEGFRNFMITEDKDE